MRVVVKGKRGLIAAERRAYENVFVGRQVHFWKKKREIS